MNTTKRSAHPAPLTVPEEEARAMLGVGLATTRLIGKKSGARIKIGNRVLYRVDKLRSYIEELGGE